MTAGRALAPAPDDKREHLKGVIVTAAGALSWSTGALLIRLVEADAWTILVFRSGWMALGMAVYIAVATRGRLVAGVREAGWGALAAGFFMALSMMLYVNSITRTSAANTLILLSTNPFMAAVLALVFLGERVRARLWVLMAAALAGMALMVGDSIGGGTWLGDVLAIGCALTFACNLVFLRRYRHVDMMPQVLFAGLIAGLLSLPAASPGAASLRDILLCAAMGVGQLGLGLVLFVYGTRRVTAAEAGLISLLESILAPVWVWLAIGEEPRQLALAGGAVVLGTLVTHGLMTLHRSRRR